MRCLAGFVLTAVVSVGFAGSAAAAAVKPGDLITPDNASLVADLVSPGNLILVKQGMRMKIVPTERLEWPPPYISATEKYSAQVRLNDHGELMNYVAGQPFPLIDANDPQVATKVMWNFSYGPGLPDDLDIRNAEVSTHQPTDAIPGVPLWHSTTGHVALYNNVGRTEVQPIPTDPEANGAGIRYRFGAFPVLEPASARGTGIVRFRYKDPRMEDNTWAFNPAKGRVMRVSADILSDAVGADKIDPDSYFGFAAKIEDFNYRLLGIKPMLAVAHAANSPAIVCEFDNKRTICPENWELRQVYIVEATAKPLLWHQRIGSDGVSIPKRILYIDSEGWFIAASDQYDREGNLWKTLATFNTYRDRPLPNSRVAIYPYRRIFELAMVDEDIESGFSSISSMPGLESKEHECWYVNMGSVTQAFIDPHQMAIHAC
ncbi:MAG: DUF1329 domain-containing protein [Candidatus Binataceae bacterium]